MALKCLRTMLLLFGVLSLLFIIACQTSSPSVKEIVPSAPADVPVSPPPVQTPAVPTQPSKVLSSEVKELLELHKKTKSFSALVDDGTPQALTLYVKANKIKKIVPPPSRYDKATLVDVFYIDRQERTVYGLCVDSFACPPERENKALPRDFVRENPVTPVDVIASIAYATKVGSETFDTRKTTIIEYTNTQGRVERLWVDTFSGIPVQQKVFDGEREVAKHTFTNIIVNSLHDEDVSLPSTAVVVS